MKLNSYLTFNGQCEAAFKFYEQCLGGKIVAMVTQIRRKRIAAIRRKNTCRPNGAIKSCTPV